MRAIRSFLLETLVCALVVGAFATPAAAQAPGPPGTPQVAVSGNNVVTISWTAPQSGGAVAGYYVQATYGGATFPGSPFFVGTLTSVSGGPLPLGSYSVAILAANESGVGTSEVTTFTIGSGAPPPVPTLAVPIVIDSTVALQWSAVANATGYELMATFAGQTLVIPVGNQTSLVAPGVPPGSYTLSVRATNVFGASAWSTSQVAVVAGPSVPGAPTLFAPAISGSNVTLTWAAPTNGGAPTGYEIEAFIQSTGQTITVPVPGLQTSVSVAGVPPGNFVVRVRARNALGAGPWSGQQIVVVGISLVTGDLVVTLIWNSDADMDLHVIEPAGGEHVYFANKVGLSAELDVDIIPDPGEPGGPEHINVRPGAALAGTYRFFIVQYNSYNANPTTSTIAVTLYPGTPNERTAIFTRTTSFDDISLGYNVADVNIGAGTIVELDGTTPFGETAEAALQGVIKR